MSRIYRTKVNYHGKPLTPHEIKAEARESAIWFLRIWLDPDNPCTPVLGDGIMGTCKTIESINYGRRELRGKRYFRHLGTWRKRHINQTRRALERVNLDKLKQDPYFVGWLKISDKYVL